MACSTRRSPPGRRRSRPTRKGAPRASRRSSRRCASGSCGPGVSSRRLPRSSLLPVLGFAATALVLGACASLSPRPAPPLDPEVAAARRLIEQRWAAFGDLRTLADLTIRRGRRAQRLSGPLLLRAPEGLRFEALTPLGPPAVVICSNRDVVTIWEVLQ